MIPSEKAGKYTYVYIHTNIHIFILIYLYIYIYVYICIYIYVYYNIYMYQNQWGDDGDVHQQWGANLPTVIGVRNQLSHRK